MKVLITHPDFAHPGGITAYFKHLQSSFRVDTVHVSVGRRPGERGAVQRVRRMCSDYCQFLTCAKALDIDVVHVNASLDWKSVLRDGILVRLAARRGIPVVVSFHGWLRDVASRVERTYLWLFHFLYGKAAAFVVLSNEVRDTLARWGFSQPIYHEATVIAEEDLEGFDLERNCAARDAAEKWSILFLGRVHRNKGIFIALEAFSRLRRKYPEMELVVAGSGEHLETLREQMEEAGIPDVRFVGYAAGREKRALLERSHVFLLPSFSEGLPVALVEAMAFGLPVVTRSVGGIGDFFKNGEHGFITDSLDAEVFAGYIERLFLEKALWASIARNNAQYARAHFLACDAAKRLERIYAVAAGRHVEAEEVVVGRNADGKRQDSTQDWNSTFDKVMKSIEALDGWLVKNDFQGYEPFDGLSSCFRVLTFGNWFAERVLQQVVLRCPFHIRPYIGVHPRQSTKGMGFLARAYYRLASLTREPAYLDKATDCLTWLTAHSSTGYSGACWGNEFDYAARPFQLSKHTPTLVWTSHIGQAFLDGYARTGDSRYLATARSVRDFILTDLARLETDEGICFSYVPFKEAYIHNANMLGAAFLARLARLTGDPEAAALAFEAMRYSCARQLPDGAWYYAEEPAYHWIDNWHTGYNLDSLKCFIESTDNAPFREHLDRGFAFYRNHFVEEDGRPKYYHDRLHVVDIQAAAHSIDTLSHFSDMDASALELAAKAACWTIDHMQDESGYFYYRKLRWKTVRIPMLHWGQATMMCALSHFLYRLHERRL